MAAAGLAVAVERDTKVVTETQTPTAVDSALPFDRYEIQVLSREVLKDAPYNPRILGEEEKKHLREGLKKHGLLAPPIWNKRTGHIVSGHQRIQQLDALYHSPKYQLKVAVVDLDDAAEREANLLLNNPSAMGDWDLEKLEDVLRFDGLDLAGAGFDLGEVFRLIGDMPGAAAPDVDELATKLREFQESYSKISDNTGRDDFYVVLVFKDYAARTSFLEQLKLSDNRYQDGKELLKLLLTQAQAVKA